MHIFTVFTFKVCTKTKLSCCLLSRTAKEVEKQKKGHFLRSLRLDVRSLVKVSSGRRYMYIFYRSVAVARVTYVFECIYNSHRHHLPAQFENTISFYCLFSNIKVQFCRNHKLYCILSEQVL